MTRTIVKPKLTKLNANGEEFKSSTRRQLMGLIRHKFRYCTNIFHPIPYYLDDDETVTIKVPSSTDEDNETILAPLPTPKAVDSANDYDEEEDNKDDRPIMQYLELDDFFGPGPSSDENSEPIQFTKDSNSPSPSPAPLDPSSMHNAELDQPACISPQVLNENNYSFNNLIAGYRQEALDMINSLDTENTNTELEEEGFLEVVYFDRFDRSVVSNYTESDFCRVSDQELIRRVKANEPIFKSPLNEIVEVSEEEEEEEEEQESDGAENVSNRSASKEVVGFPKLEDNDAQYDRYDNDKEVNDGSVSSGCEELMEFLFDSYGATSF